MHIAVRILALAGPGEVLVSGAIPQLVLGSRIAFADKGSHELKGVPTVALSRGARCPRLRLSVPRTPAPAVRARRRDPRRYRGKKAGSVRSAAAWKWVDWLLLGEYRRDFIEGHSEKEWVVNPPVRAGPR